MYISSSCRELAVSGAEAAGCPSQPRRAQRATAGTGIVDVEQILHFVQRTERTLSKWLHGLSPLPAQAGWAGGSRHDRSGRAREHAHPLAALKEIELEHALGEARSGRNRPADHV